MGPFKKKVLLVLTAIVVIIDTSAAYDMMFNTDRDLNQWKFNGSYIYSRQMQDIAALLPPAVLRIASPGREQRPGLWLIRYAGPRAHNFLTLDFALHHHLMHQGLVNFIASPNVAVKVTTNNGAEIGTYWSDGRNWCDAYFNVNMHTQIKINISTPNPGNYALIDKVILGVMGNLTFSRQLNPCKTSPPSASYVEEDVLAPDMTQQSIAARVQYQDHRPDMATKQRYAGPAVQGAPDMERKNEEGVTPRLDTRTTTNEIAVESNGSSDVKCGCSCSCSRQRNKKTNATIVPTATG